MDLSIDYGIKLLRKAYESRADDLLMQRWLLHYQDVMSFQDFKDKVISHSTVDNKTKEEILEEVKDILDTFNGEVR